MELLFPNFMWVLAALAIPVIIHLFYFKRYKKVYFTNVKHLKEIKEQTSNRNRIRNFLVLLSRLLALACLVFAFVQPIMGKRKATTANQAVGIFVDNSFSMDARKDDVPLLDIAKQYARDIINAYGDGDDFQILTHDLEGKHQRYYNKGQALDLIDEISISPKSSTLGKVVNRHYQLTQTTENDASVYIISDFQKNTSVYDTDVDTNVMLHLLPLQGMSSVNVSLDTAYLETIVPTVGTQTDIVVKISNNSNQRAEGIRLSSNYDGIQKPEGSYDIDANASITDTIAINLKRTGIHKIRLEVEDYPITYDNSYYVSIRVPEEINILSINEGKANSNIAKVQSIVSGYNVTQQSSRNIDFNALRSNNLIILDDLTNLSSGLIEQLRAYTSSGGNILVFPSARSVEGINTLLRRLGIDTYEQKTNTTAEVKTINTSEYIFSDVYVRREKDATLPKSSLHYKLTNNQRNRRDALMIYRDGSPYLNKYTVQKGRVYLCTAPLDVKYNDLVKIGEVFVPMIVKMSIARDRAQNIAYTIGKNQPISVDLPSQVSEQLVKLKNDVEIIPGQQIQGNTAVLDTRRQVKQEGFYDVMVDDKVIDVASYNYDRTESSTAVLSDTEIDSLASKYGASIIRNNVTASLSSLVQEKNTGKALWPYLILAALLFLLIETLLLKFWKTT